MPNVTSLRELPPPLGGEPSQRWEGDFGGGGVRYKPSSFEH